MDWDKFKRDTAHLNRPRTKEERIRIFKEEAERAYDHAQCAIPTVKINKTDKIDFSIKRSPVSFKEITASYVKKYLFTKNFVDLVDHITGEGIYPQFWDEQAIKTRDQMVEIRFFRPDNVFAWAKANYVDDSEIIIKKPENETEID